MPDGSINVKITADASGFITGVNTAQQGSEQLGQAAQRLAEAMSQAAAQVEQAGQRAANAGTGFQQLKRHLEERPAGLSGALKELTEGLDGALKPITGVIGGVQKLGEVIVAGFAVEKIKAFVESMTELGETSLKFSSITGASVEQFSGFAAMMRIVGADAESAGRTLERLQRNMSQALAQPTGRAAEGFIALGINLQDLSSRMNNAVSMVDLLADKWNEFEDGAEKTAAFIATMGRGFDQLAAYMRKTKAEREEFKRSLADIGATMDQKTGNVSIISTDQAHAMEETGEKANFLSLALQGVAISVYDHLKPAIDGTIDSLTGLAVAFRNDVEAGGPFGQLVNILGEAVQVLNTWLTGAQISLRMFAAAGRDVFNDFAGGAKALGQALTGDFSGAWKTWSETAKNRTAEVDKEFQKLLDDIAKATAAQNVQRNWMPGQGMGHEKVGLLSGEGAAGKDNRVAEWRAELDERLEHEHDFFKESRDNELKFWRDKIEQNQAGWNKLKDARTDYIREYQEWYKKYTGGQEIAAADVPYSETPEQHKQGIRGPDEKRAVEEERQVRRQIYDLEKAQAREALAEKLRLIEAEKSEQLKANDEALENAKNNEAERMRLLRARIAIIDEAYAKERAANTAAGRVLTPDQTRTQEAKQKGEESEGRKRITAEEQKVAEEHARDQIKLLEIARKGADEQEKLALHVLQHRVSLGQLTAEAAGAAELQIAQAHDARVAQILEQEARQAEGQKKLMEEVRDRAIEIEQQEADKRLEIQEKADEERLKRAKEVDKELASSLASALTGKKPIGQALNEFFEQQEKKLLEKSLEKLFQQSGIGDLFGGLFDLGGSNNVEDALKAATAANTQSTDKNTGVLERLIAALDQKIKSASGTETGTGTGTRSAGAGTGTALDVGQPGSGQGGTVTTEQVAAAGAKYGFSAAYSNAVVDIESSHGANLGHGKYGGNILQVGPEERKSLGVTGMGTPEEQLDYGFKLMAQYRKELSAKLGREATEDETYLAHNQGPGGAYALLTHPNEPAGQVIREATHGREGAANIASNFHGDPERSAGEFWDRVQARLHRGENRFGGTGESQVLASAGAEHKQAAEKSNAAADKFDHAADKLVNSPTQPVYDQATGKFRQVARPPAVAASTSESEPPPALQEGGMVTSTGLALVHAGEAVLPPDLARVAATAPLPPAAPGPSGAGPSATAPIPIDIRAVAGRVITPPATTSGGGLPTSDAAPPSAPLEEPAAATAAYDALSPEEKAQRATAEIPPAKPGFFGQIGEDLKDFAADPLGHVGRQLDQLGPSALNAGEPQSPEFAANAKANALGPAYAGLSDDEIRATLAASATAPIPPETFEQFYGKPSPPPPFGGEGMLTREHEAAVRADTKAIEQHTQARTAPSPGSQPASGGSPEAADATKEGNGLLGQLLGLLPLVAALIGLTSKNKTERAVGLGIGGVGLLSLLGKGGIPAFEEGGPVDETGLALLHKGEFVVPADLVNAAAADRSEPLKLGAGRDTSYDTALRALMEVSGASDVGEAIASGKKILPALQRGDTDAAMRAGWGTLISGGMVLGGMIMPEGKTAEALAGAARLDKFGRTLRDLAIAIPPETRRIGPFESAIGTRPVVGGADWLHLDLTKLGTGLHIGDAELHAAFDKAIADTIAGAKERGPEIAKRIAQFKEDHPGFGPGGGLTGHSPAEFWGMALKLPDRARYWYEISARKVQAEGLAGNAEAQRRTFDMLAATSPQLEPDPNLRRALGVLAEHAQNLPTDVDLMNQATARNALAPEGLEGLKTGSFSGTMQHVGGLTETPPLSVNDRQVASFMGIDDDKVFSNTRDNWLYETVSRYLQNFRDAENAARPGVAAGTENPLETWQLQALGWVKQRALKNPAKAAVDAYDDYALAIDRLKGELGAVGVDVSQGLFSKKVLLDPRVQNLVSGTREAFQAAPIATVEVASSLTPEGARATALAQQIAALPPGTRGLAKASADFEALQRRAMSSLATRVKKQPSPIEDLISAVVGKKVSVTRIDTGGYGTFEGATNPNMRIPLTVGTSSGERITLTEEQRAAVLSALGQDLSQEAMAASRFTTVEHGPGAQTYSLFIPETGAPLSSTQISAFGKAVGGYPLNVSRTATGTLLDINIGGFETAPALLDVQNASDKVFGAGSGAKALARVYSSDYVQAVEYKAKLDAFWRARRLSDVAGGGAGAGNTERDLGDFERARARVREIAAKRDQDYAKWAADYGPAVERATGARAGPLSRTFPTPETMPLAADEPPAAFLGAHGGEELLAPDAEIESIGAAHGIPTRGITRDEFFEQYARAIDAETIGGQIPLHENPETERAFIEAQKRLGLDHESQLTKARALREKTIEGSATEIPGPGAAEEMPSLLARPIITPETPSDIAARVGLPTPQSSRGLTLEEIGKTHPLVAQHIAEQLLQKERIEAYESDIGNRWALTPAELAARDKGAAQIIGRELVFHTHPDLVTDEMIAAAGYDRAQWADQNAIYASSRTPDVAPRVVWDPKAKTWVIVGGLAGGGAAALGGEAQAQPVPGLATGGTVTQGGLAQIHAGETIVPAKVLPIQTIQAGAQQSQPGPGPVGQTTQNSWLGFAEVIAALTLLSKLLGGFGGKGTGTDPAVTANTQATQQGTQAKQENTQALQQNTAAKQGAVTPPVTSGEIGGTGTPGTGIDVGLLRTAVSGQSAGGEEIKQFAKGGPVEKTGLAMLHAGEYVVPSSDDGDLVEMITNPLTGNQVPRFGADGADWAMANLAEWKEGPSGSLAQRAWSSVKGAGSWAWSFNPFNAKQFSAQSFSSNSVLGGMSWEQAQALTPLTAFSVLDLASGAGPGGGAKSLMANLGGGEPDATGGSGGGMMAWLSSLWSPSAEAAPAYAEGGVVSAASGNIVVPGEIAPVATQGSASPVLPSTRGVGKGWELWAAILALLMLMGGGKKGGGAGTDAAKLAEETADNPLPDAEAAALGEQQLADDLLAPDVRATGGASACEGALMPSAAGGLQVHETSLPQRIKSGVRGLAAKGKTGLFRAGRLTSSMRGAPVADGKGGQLAVVHPGEMILPAPETSHVLSAMSSEGGAIVPSAAGGSVVALPEQQTVSSLGFQPITLEAANPTSNLGGLTQILALIMALEKLLGGLDGLFGGNTSPTGTKGQGGGLFGGDGLLGGILSLPQKLLGGLGNLLGVGGGQTSGGGANSGIEGMTQAANAAAPALQGVSSSSSNASNALLGLVSKLFSFGGGGGGGGGLGIFGSVFGLIGGIIGLEKGGVIPSAAGGMVVGADGAVPDGKGGRLIVAHPQEMVLPAREARGLSNLLANFQGAPPAEGGLGRILSMRMMTPQVPHFAQGAWEIDHDMMGQLHQGEAVLPSSFADGMRAMGGRAPTTSSPNISYGDTHVHLSAIDSRSGAQFLMAHSDAIAKSFFKAHRNGSRFTPGG